MRFAPKTRQEAELYRYGEWAGNPDGRKYRPDQCAHEVWHKIRSCQCERKNGHGPDGLYCKQHAKRYAP